MSDIPLIITISSAIIAWTGGTAVIVWWLSGQFMDTRKTFNQSITEAKLVLERKIEELEAVVHVKDDEMDDRVRLLESWRAAREAVDAAIRYQIATEQQRGTGR